MYRIIYIAKNGKSYDVSFRGPGKPYDYGDKRQVLYEIKTDDSEFTYRFVIVKEGNKRLDDEAMQKLLLRVTFRRMQQLLDEGKEEDCEDTISRKNLPGKWPPSFIDYPKICSYRIETNEGLICKAAAPDDKTGGATKAKICENDCDVPQDFERCRHRIVETRGITGDQIVGVANRSMPPPDCEIKDIDSEEECKKCPDYEAIVIKSDITGESLEPAQKLPDLEKVKAKPSGWKKIFKVSKRRVLISGFLCLFALGSHYFRILDIKAIVAGLILLVFATYVLPSPRR